MKTINVLSKTTLVLFLFGFISILAAELHSNDDFTFESLKDILFKNDIKTIPNLLKVMPEAVMKNFVLLRRSKSLQEASDLFPRVIVHSPSAKFMMAFNGSQKHRGFNQIEIIQYRDSTKQFDFKEITFDPRSVLPPKINEKPGKCVACHGLSSPRPLWEPYYFWPNAYGALRDSIGKGSKEEKQYARFLKDSRPQGRYQYLRGNLELQNVTGAYMIKQAKNIMGLPNLRFYFVLNALNLERIAELLKNSADFRSYQYAILGALMNCDNLVEFLPMNLRSNFPISEKDYLQSTLEANHRIAEKRSSATREFVTRNFGKRNIYVNSNQTALNHFAEYFDNISILSKLRFILENRDISTDSWSLSDSFSSFSFDPRPTVVLDSILEFFVQPLAQLGISLQRTEPSVIQNSRYFFGKYSTSFEPTWAAELFSIHSIKEQKTNQCKILQVESLKSLEKIWENTKEKPRPIVQSPHFSTVLQMCTTCHSSELKIGPYFPFDNPKRLRKLFSKNKKFRKKLFERIYSETDPMPPTQRLSENEKNALGQYFRSFLPSEVRH